jgi:hypothetical protein
VERLIGTIRREFLDHVRIWNAIDLGRNLGDSEFITTKIAVTSRSVAALQENDLANRRPHAVLDHYTLAAPLSRSVPDANRSVITNLP